MRYGNFSKMAAVRHLVFVMRVWTTHEQYMLVFTAVQNLVGTGTVVLKICEFQYYANVS